MAALEDVSNIRLVIETLSVKNGRHLNTLIPDEDGYYTLPLAVLGIVSENATYYYVKDFIEKASDPRSRFYHLLTDGKLYGERGHPQELIYPPANEFEKHKLIARLMHIDDNLKSHHIRKIWVSDETLENGGKIIYGLVKPFGEKGKDMEEGLRSKWINTAFSLRALTAESVQNGIRCRSIRELVTFDWVTGGGYQEASKRYSPNVVSMEGHRPNPNSANDNVCYDIGVYRNQLESLRVMNGTTCSTESYFKNTELNEIFGTNHVMIRSQSYTVGSQDDLLIDRHGHRRSLFSEIMTKKG